jgi:hypothetical protein
MARLSLYLALATFAVIGLALGTGIYSLLRHEPTFYRIQMAKAEPKSIEKAKEFASECIEFIAAVGTEKEESSQKGKPEKILPDFLQSPRIALENDRLRFAFRLGSGKLSTVVSADLKLWLAKDEPNVMAIQISSLKAGAIPVSLVSIFDRLLDQARQNGIDANWYRYKGNPVVVIRFQADQARPTMLFQALEVEKGSITIRGKNLEINRTAAASTAN